jgi:hypothetical protein
MRRTSPDADALGGLAKHLGTERSIVFRRAGAGPLFAIRFLCSQIAKEAAGLFVISEASQEVGSLTL